MRDAPDPSATRSVYDTAGVGRVVAEQHVDMAFPKVFEQARFIAEAITFPKRDPFRTGKRDADGDPGGMQGAGVVWMEHAPFDRHGNRAGVLGNAGGSTWRAWVMSSVRSAGKRSLRLSSET